MGFDEKGNPASRLAGVTSYTEEREDYVIEIYNFAWRATPTARHQTIFGSPFRRKIYFKSVIAHELTHVAAAETWDFATGESRLEASYLQETGGGLNFWTNYSAIREGEAIESLAVAVATYQYAHKQLDETRQAWITAQIMPYYAPYLPIVWR